MFTSLIAAFLLAGPAYASSLDTLTLVVEGKSVQFTLKDLKKKLKTVTVTIDDPVYQSQKTYDGFGLIELLGLAGFHENSRGDEIVFTASDGYSPNAAFSDLQAHKALLAFQEHGNPKQFDLVTQGKMKVSPGPYYVVWAEGKKLADKVPWPYQLVKIEVVNFMQKFDKIFPQKPGTSLAVMQGFRVFKANCIRCHSLNLQGGDLGPELNVPKNITEYWDPKTMRAFIKDASSFRLKDKMPAFPKLSEEDLDNLFEYFIYMKGQKI